jgi:hypothetical protein
LERRTDTVITPTLIGIVIALLLQFGLASFAGFVADCCGNGQSAPPLWYAVVSSPLGGLAAVAPGFVAGWLSRRRGILAGFLTGLLGQVIYAGTLHTMWSTVVEDGAVLEMIIRLFALGLSAAIGGAASAGAALYLRSNNALYATRADARA